MQEKFLMRGFIKIKNNVKIKIMRFIMHILYHIFYEKLKVENGKLVNIITEVN